MIMKSILFATDGSRPSEHAGEMVKDYLKAWPEAVLYVLYVNVKENYAYDLVPDVVDNYEERIKQDIEETIKCILYNYWKEMMQFNLIVGPTIITICVV